jgi:hypothetical protein
MAVAGRHPQERDGATNRAMVGAGRTSAVRSIAENASEAGALPKGR